MPESPRARLRELITRDGITIVPGVTDAFEARLAQQAGFDAIFTTGAGIANTLLGVPDIGLTTMTEVVGMTAHVVEAVSVPVIGDADTGYGNHLNVMRTIREMEHAGVAGFFIEDQVSPKRCGHFDGKSVVSEREMVEKITAAVMARSDPEMVLIARTDAIAVEGLDGALRRARAYVAAGAEVIFVEAPRDERELAAIPAALEVPCLVNMVEGGVSPLMPAARLEEMGYRIVIHANLALRAAARAVAHAFEVLRSEGGSASLLDEILPWEERQRTVALESWRAVEQDVLARAAAALAAGESSGK